MVSIEDIAEQIMIDLVKQGYSGNDLLERFRKEVDQICPAIKSTLEETRQLLLHVGG